jgi:hypothetical protein
MFNWSSRVTKSITFTQEAEDRELLARIEAELDRHPNITFSDLCKEALWQLLNVPSQAVAPSSVPLTVPAATPSTVGLNGPTPTVSPTDAPLDSPARDEEIARLRLLAQQSSRFEAIEQQLQQLAQRLESGETQQAQPSNLSQPAQPHGNPSSAPMPAPSEPPQTVDESRNSPPHSAEADPVISRLSQYLDDF